MYNKHNCILLLSAMTIIIFSGTTSAFWNKDKGNEKQIENKAETDLGKEKNAQVQNENKLVQLDSLENAFLKSEHRRKMLAVNFLNLKATLKQTDDEKEKKEINGQIEQTQKELEVLNVAMDVVFSPTRPRQYEFNPVKSTVYVKVGNIEQVFLRTVQVRDGLLKAIQEHQKRLDESKTEEEKKKAQKGMDNLQRQYQTLVAALQLVFDIIPQRNYLYNPKDSTLYLKVTEAEAKKIQEKINEMSQPDKRQNGDESQK